MTENAASKAFRKMADDIEHNSGASFGGAVVIVPPEGGGDVISTLLIGSNDIMQFFSLLNVIQARCQEKINEITGAKRTNAAFIKR